MLNPKQIYILCFHSRYIPLYVVDFNHNFHVGSLPAGIKEGGA